MRAGPGPGGPDARKPSFSRGGGVAEPRLLRPREVAGAACEFCDEPFSLLRRQKHCRRCGRAHHEDCLPHLVPLPDMLYGDVQPICTACKEALDEEVVVTACPRRRKGELPQQWLELRRDPREGAPVAHSVSAGARMVLEDAAGDWVQLRRRGAGGWAARRDVVMEGCDENCNATHDWDGECRRCGQRWDAHAKGHACPGGGRGSFAAVDQVEDRNCRVVVASWNVGEAPPPTAEAEAALLRRWLRCHDGAPDVVAVGLQEVDMSQRAMVTGESDKAGPWLEALQKAVGNEMGMIFAQQLGGVLLAVYTRRPGGAAAGGLGDAGTWVAQDIREGIVRRGAAGGMLANKGGVGVRMRLHRTTLAFVSAHLAAHQNKVEERNEDFQAIVDTMLFEDETGEAASGLLDTDRVFFFGDLNYRVDLPYADAVALIQRGDIPALLERDQLQNEMRKPLSPYARLRWKEAVPTFNPTYKYDTGTDAYDTSEKRRVPAWCDRVLWWARPYGNRLWGLAVAGRKVRRAAAIVVDDSGGGEGALRDPVKLRAWERTELRTSDHRPVCAELEVLVSALAGHSGVKAQASFVSPAGALSRTASRSAVAKPINFFDPAKAWGQLSTFYPSPFTDSAMRRWPSLEHWYQGAKFEGTAGQSVLQQMPTPELAHEHGRRGGARWGGLRKDWEAVKEGVMYAGILLKFEQNARCRAALLATASRALRYRDHDDPFWGTGPEGDGLNRLGELLQRAREELRSRESEPLSLGPGSAAAPELALAFPCRLLARGLRWDSAVHFYQAHRFAPGSAGWAAVRGAGDADAAREQARAHRQQQRADWAEVRRGVMREALTAKHMCDPDCRAALLGTGSRQFRLADGEESFWGVGADGGGVNELGKLLGEVRDDVRWACPSAVLEFTASDLDASQVHASFSSPAPLATGGRQRRSASALPQPAPKTTAFTFGGADREQGAKRKGGVKAIRDSTAQFFGFQRADLRPGIFQCCRNGPAACASMVACFPCHLGGLMGSLSSMQYWHPARAVAAFFCCPCATCMVRQQLVDKAGKEEDMATTILATCLCTPCVYFQLTQMGWAERHIISQPWSLRGCCTRASGPPSPPAGATTQTAPKVRVQQDDERPLVKESLARTESRAESDDFVQRAFTLASSCGAPQPSPRAANSRAGSVRFDVPQPPSAQELRRRKSLWAPPPQAESEGTGTSDGGQEGGRETAPAFADQGGEEELGGFAFGCGTGGANGSGAAGADACSSGRAPPSSARGSSRASYGGAVDAALPVGELVSSLAAVGPLPATMGGDAHSVALGVSLPAAGPRSSFSAGRSGRGTVAGTAPPARRRSGSSAGAPAPPPAGGRAAQPSAAAHPLHFPPPPVTVSAAADTERSPSDLLPLPPPGSRRRPEAVYHAQHPCAAPALGRGHHSQVADQPAAPALAPSSPQAVTSYRPLFSSGPRGYA
eukprot:TRINITY_DN11299_c0_g1_i1.p1 TRINITY_DN11299_c0_g1~~TRINITY_DN11299_c0_g1_i1.p1  ORF type:complete len:1481 (+),score=363.37 TRINITY_DN11299_c0_g1_i1:97-4443(+)